jgi:hypothetical protein
LPIVLLGGILFTDGLAARALCDEDDPDEAVVVEQFTFSEQQFDQRVFGGTQQVVIEEGQRRVVSSNGPTAITVRERMEQALSSELHTVDQQCSLTDAQKTKLRLAGRGDIVRWLNRVLELRQKWTAVAMNRQQYTELMTELQQLRTVPQFGPFGESSLFRKTLRTALTDEQLGRYRVLERERRVQAIGSVLETWDRDTNRVTLLPFTTTRRKFIDTIVDRGHFPDTHSPYFRYVVLLEASRMEDQLKPLLAEIQWQTFQTQVTQARQAEPTLRKLGLWPARSLEDDDEMPTDEKKE